VPTGIEEAQMARREILIGILAAALWGALWMMSVSRKLAGWLEECAATLSRLFT
jgi:hypothetical protein